jgi:hypothetical protein
VIGNHRPVACGVKPLHHLYYVNRITQVGWISLKLPEVRTNTPGWHSSVDDGPAEPH